VLVVHVQQQFAVLVAFGNVRGLVQGFHGPRHLAPVPLFHISVKNGLNLGGGSILILAIGSMGAQKNARQKKRFNAQSMVFSAFGQMYFLVISKSIKSIILEQYPVSLSYQPMIFTILPITEVIKESNV